MGTLKAWRRVGAAEAAARTEVGGGRLLDTAPSEGRHARLRQRDAEMNDRAVARQVPSGQRVSLDRIDPELARRVVRPVYLSESQIFHTAVRLAKEILSQQTEAGHPTIVGRAHHDDAPRPAESGYGRFALTALAMTVAGCTEVQANSAMTSFWWILGIQGLAGAGAAIAHYRNRRPEPAIPSPLGRALVEHGRQLWSRHPIAIAMGGAYAIGMALPLIRHPEILMPITAAWGAISLLMLAMYYSPRLADGFERWFLAPRDQREVEAHTIASAAPAISPTERPSVSI